MARDTRVDLFRGLALIVIFIDHVAGNVLSRVTPSAMGLSDAAEYFVLLAGYSAALAYGTAFNRDGIVQGSAQVVARIWKLYMAHLGLFLFMAVAVAFMATKFGNPLYYEHVAILPFFQDPATALVQIASLMFLPNYLDILPLYIVLLALLPALWGLARIAPMLALLASGGLYAAAWSLDLTLPNLATGGTWFFNPFAWQFLFTVGLVAGHATLSGLRLSASRLLFVGAVAFLAFGLINAAPWTALPGLDALALPDGWRIEADKTNLSPWRLVHALALAYVVARLVPVNAAWLESTPARLFTEAGKHSLPLFGLGVILSLLGTFVFFEVGRDWTMQFAVNIFGIGALLTAARVLSWYRTAVERRGVPAAKPLNEVRTA
ncbi:MAG: OpgC domain-containing protein [Alphaproteobacteria bacterium]